MCAPKNSIQMRGELCHKPRYAFIGLKGSAEELQLTASNLWALPSKDLEKDAGKLTVDSKLLNSSSRLGFKVKSGEVLIWILRMSCLDVGIFNKQISKRLFGLQNSVAESKQLGDYSG